MKIGVVAVQGAFIEHIHMLETLGCDCIELRKKGDICSLDGLVLPGGESTVQGKLLNELNMFDTLQDMIKKQVPTLGTCAGLILMANSLSNDPNVYFGTLPVTVKRNAYGRQLGSYEQISSFKGVGDFNMTFIRAPYIENVGTDVSVLATIDNHIVAAQYKKQIGLAFHPELGNDTRIHQYFLNQIH